MAKTKARQRRAFVLVDLVLALSHTTFSRDLEALSRRDWRPVKWRPRPPQPETLVRRRFGTVKDRVVDVLAEADTELSYSEIHRALEELLDEPVARSSVKNALTRGCLGRRPVFERVAHGRYRRLQ